MPVNVTMPALSPTMTEGTLAKWLKAEGDLVAPGDVIAEIETDKATMEVEAVDQGVLGKILIPAGTQGVAVNSVIALLLEEGEGKEALVTATASSVPAPLSPAPTASPSVAPHKNGVSSVPASALLPSSQGGRIKASPLAKRIAQQAGLDLSKISGSGPHGRIVATDVQHAAKSASGKGAPAPATRPAAAGPSASVPTSPDAKQLADLLGMAYTELPNSGVRKVIARRLLESKQTVPHFYLSVECALDALLSARKVINEQNDGVKLSVNDFVIKAVANALAAFPAANVAWTEEAVLQFHHADISVAVATPNGLITPIIKKAETKGLKSISEEMKDLAARARDGKLRPEEFQGGTFSISNLGMFGINNFQAIINPPQACILAVGAGEDRAVVVGGKVEIRTMMTCTLSVDHRAVDGSVGAQFLQIFKRLIENPVHMLL